MSVELTGLACPFYRPGVLGTEYQLADGRVERFAPTAFDRALRSGQSVSLELLHNCEVTLARTGDGTMRLWTDPLGLWLHATPAGEYAKLVAELVAGCTLRGLSVTFTARESRSFTEGGRHILEHLDVELVAVAPVAHPAYSATTVSVRGALAEVPAGELL